MSCSERLNNYIMDALCQPFDWRAANCCHFVSGWIQAERSVEVEVPSLRAGLRRTGGVWERVVPAISEHLGTHATAAAYARPGDIVLLRLTERRWALGICEGELVAFRTEHGVIYCPRSLCGAAWSLNMIRSVEA